MSLQLVESWFFKLPEYERAMPIMKYNNVSYTPQQILREVRKGTALGESLQGSFESLRLANTISDEKLAEERIIKLLRERPVNIAALVSPEYGKEEFTSEELIEHIKKKTDIGKSLISAEMRQMEAMLKVGGV